MNKSSVVSRVFEASMNSISLVASNKVSESAIIKKGLESNLPALYSFTVWKKCQCYFKSFR